MFEFTIVALALLMTSPLVLNYGLGGATEDDYKHDVS